MDVERAEERGGKVEDVIDGTGVEKGKPKSSELEISNKVEDNIEEVSDCTGVGVMKEEVDLISISQDSPVHPVKHRQVKLSPNSSAIQLPLLHSTKSQTDISGLGVGLANLKLAVSTFTSQNNPVQPGKHSHVTIPLSRLIH